MDCPICYDVVEGDRGQKLDCVHIVCKVCLQRLRSKTCPLCRTPITIPYEQCLLPTTEDEDELELDLNGFYWENIYGYEFEFSVQIDPSGHRRRSLSLSDVTPPPRRRRRRRIHSDSDQPPPIVPLIVNPDEIVPTAPVIETGDIEHRSESDFEQQKTRTRRSIWNNVNRHNRGVRHCR